MSNKSISSANRGKADSKDWEKPYPDFPLSYHPPSGRLYKKIRGKRHYFGYASDWQDATEKFANEKDDLYAGRTPRATGDGLTVKDLANRFLTAKTHALNAGEITNRTFRDYKSTTDRVVSMFGANRLVDDLASDDFESLRASIASTRGPVALGNEVQRVKVLFKYGYDAGLIDKPVRYGQTFKRPSKKVLRKERHKNGVKMFERSDVRTIIDAAGVQLRAMVLLAINCGFGNEDCGNLSKSHIDSDASMIDYPRPKTGIERRCPLWPETVEAVRAAIADRTEPKDESDTELVFITKYGQSWSKQTSTNPISAEFRKLLQGVGLHRNGRGFYAIRHTFRTIADETRDFPAIDLIMGHSDNTMGGHYRERISDDRLRAVVDHVHGWLYGKPEADANSDATEGTENG